MIMRRLPLLKSIDNVTVYYKHRLSPLSGRAGESGPEGWVPLDSSENEGCL